MRSLKRTARENGARVTGRVKSFRGPMWTLRRDTDGSEAYVMGHPGKGTASFCVVDGTTRDAVPWRRIHALVLRWARGEG